VSGVACVAALIVFEVMDKEPSLFGLALWYGVLCALAYLASRIRWWLGLLLLPVIGISGFFGNIAEVRDPFIGPAILQEAGKRYVTLSYAMLLTAIAFPIIAALRRRKAQRTRITGG
jgi:hypothetical protein